MKRRVGAPVHEPCPECGSYELKVALLTTERVYYRCIACHHAWSEVERRKRPSGGHVPERRRRRPVGPVAEADEAAG